MIHCIAAPIQTSWVVGMGNNNAGVYVEGQEFMRMSGMKSKMDQESKYQERRAGAVAVDLEETRFFAMWGEMCKKEGCEECPSSPCRRMQKSRESASGKFSNHGMDHGKNQGRIMGQHHREVVYLPPRSPFSSAAVAHAAFASVQGRHWADWCVSRGCDTRWCI